MKPIEMFGTVPRPQDMPGLRYLSQMLGTPKNTEDYWEGNGILAQFKCGTGYLVLYDGYSLFENAPSWVLLSDDFELLDEGGCVPYPYQGDETIDIQSDGDHAVTFTYLGRHRHLHILSRPKWHVGSVLNTPSFLPVIRRRWLLLQRGKKVR